MTDPYKVLGVSRDASMDEIKKAYRTLSRKYHPDANINNPNKDKAEEMFKLVQQAYKQIVDERERGMGSAASGGGQSTGGAYGNRGGYGSYGGFGSYGSRGYGSSGADYSDPEMRAAANYINAQHYTEAMNVLNQIRNRTGTWYYLRAIANAGLGNSADAVTDAQTAVNMEPGNVEFQRLYQQLSRQGDWYQSMGEEYGYGAPCENGGKSSMNSCLSCCLFSSLCSCLCPGSFCCCPGTFCC